jgi:CDP-paratose 2-epimerase
MFITDNSKIEQEIGWKPKKNTTTIFSDIFEWIRENEEALTPILK